MILDCKKAETADNLAHSALLGATPIFSDPRLDNLPRSIRDGLIVKAAIAYLVEHDIITTTRIYDEPAWLPLELPDWFEQVITEATS